MMESRQYLQIPGPTNIPERILRSLSRSPINHRGPAFKRLTADCLEGLKRTFRTRNDVLILTGSGSGALESAVVNLFSPGDKVAVASIGLFSERMALIAEGHGLPVIRLARDWGRAIKADDVGALLEEDTAALIKAVCLPHVETATGVSNDIEAIARTMSRSGHPALLVVDAVSSMACQPLETDEWGVDVVVSASQKGFMLPPGLSFVSLSPKAWAMVDRSSMPRWYWDYKALRSRLAAGQFPYTPPTSLLFGLKESLSVLEEEGLENVWKRHALLASAVRGAASAMGLSLFAEERSECDVVTAIRLPEGFGYQEFSDLLRQEYHVIIGGGLERLRGKIFRIGHLGAIHKPEIFAVMGAVELALIELGCSVEPGTANRAVSELFLGKSRG